jgi:ribonuclease P protein component
VLPKKIRLTKKKDFEKIFRQGDHLAEKFLVLKLAENNLDYSRFGFIVGLKVSKKAVVRNRIRRQIQESIRTNINGIKNGFDIIILARPTIKDKSYKEINLTVKSALKKRGLIAI